MNQDQTELRKASSLKFLDGLRGLAALYVLIFHVRWLLWEGFTEGYITHPYLYPFLSKIAAYLSLAFYYGHQAVIFFFVLSGFVIHLRYAAQLKQESQDPGKETQFDLLPFLYRRIKRLYPPLFLAVILTTCLDATGIAQGFSVYTHNTFYPLINGITINYSLQGGVSNFLLIPGSPTWGTNIPLWSLFFEGWFYLFYPLFWWLSKRSIGLSTFILIVLCGLSFIPQIWPIEALRLLFSAMIIWWFGVLLADIYMKRLSIPFWKIAPLAGLLLVLPFMVAPLVELNSALQDILWGLGFTGILAGLIAWQNRGYSLRLLERLKFLGDMSYTLYVIHFPILVLMSGWLMARYGGRLPRDFGWALVGVIICLVLAYLGHLIVEKPFANRRRSLSTKWRYAKP